MTRDELEAALWRLLPAGTTGDTVDTILAAADAYSTFTGGITAERRAVLAAGARVIDRRRSLACAVHMPGDDGQPACNIPGALHTTTVVADVNCARCKDTHAYQRAAQEVAAA